MQTRKNLLFENVGQEVKRSRTKDLDISIGC